MAQSLQLRCGSRNVRVISTEVSDGDFAVARAAHEREQVRRQTLDLPWTWLNQVHGVEVVEVTRPGEHAGAVADGALTFAVGCPIAVTTADCSPVVLTTTDGVAVVHAGWKGALAGVVGAAAEQLLANGGKPDAAWLGPCIAAESYQFGPGDLQLMEQRFGPGVVSETARQEPALDMFEVIKSACLEAGWPAPEINADTAGPNFFSHRARNDKGRQTTVAYIYE